jgi:hypothetical protein
MGTTMAVARLARNRNSHEYSGLVESYKVFEASGKDVKAMPRAAMPRVPRLVHEASEDKIRSLSQNTHESSVRTPPKSKKDALSDSPLDTLDKINLGQVVKDVDSPITMADRLKHKDPNSPTNLKGKPEALQVSTDTKAKKLTKKEMQDQQLLKGIDWDLEQKQALKEMESFEWKNAFIFSANVFLRWNQPQPAPLLRDLEITLSEEIPQLILISPFLGVSQNRHSARVLLEWDRISFIQPAVYGKKNAWGQISPHNNQSAHVTIEKFMQLVYDLGLMTMSATKYRNAQNDGTVHLLSPLLDPFIEIWRSLELFPDDSLSKIPGTGKISWIQLVRTFCQINHDQAVHKTLVYDKEVEEIREEEAALQAHLLAQGRLGEFASYARRTPLEHHLPAVNLRRVIRLLKMKGLAHCGVYLADSIVLDKVQPPGPSMWLRNSDVEFLIASGCSDFVGPFERGMNWTPPSSYDADNPEMSSCNVNSCIGSACVVKAEMRNEILAIAAQGFDVSSYEPIGRR